MRKILVGLAAAAVLVVPGLSGAQSRYASTASFATVKILVKQNGWYRVSAASLNTAGFTFPADPETLRLTTGGNPVPFEVRNQNVEFYGQALDIESTDTRPYWLTTSATGTASHMAIVKARATPGSPGGSFAFTTTRGESSFSTSQVRYNARILNGSATNWFGPPVLTGLPAVSLTATANHVDTSLGGAVAVTMQGNSTSPSAHSVSVSLNGTVVGTATGSGFSQYSSGSLAVAPGAITEGSNTIAIADTGASGDFSYVVSASLTYPHQFLADSDSLTLTSTPGVPVSLGNFSSGAVRVIDITNPSQPRELAAEVRQQGGTFTASLTPPAGATKLYAFADTTALTPSAIVGDTPSDLKNASNAANLLIISYADFIPSLGPLVAYRQGEGKTVKVVDVQDVFDEFSFGTHDPQAIKDFLQYANTNWATKPHYVLLVGDASYDPRNFRGFGNFDFVPTLFLDTAFTVVPTDDSFADFNNDGVPEMAVGRLSVRTAQQATDDVSKIVGYEQGAVQPNASRTAVLVSDAHIDYQFTDFSADLRDNVLIPGGMLLTNITSINRPDPPTSSGDSSARSQVLSAANQGPTIMNFFGHGNQSAWTSGNLMIASDAATLTNTTPTLYLMMTCLNGYFVEPSPVNQGLGEQLVNAPHGAVAVWASTGETVPFDQVNADKKATGEILTGTTLGQAMIDAKAFISDIDVRHSWALLGDPTTTLR